MRVEITEDEFATRVKRGTATACRICYDMRKKIVIIGYVADGKKELRWGICDECRKAMSACPTCAKNAGG